MINWKEKQRVWNQKKYDYKKDGRNKNIFNIKKDAAHFNFKRRIIIKTIFYFFCHVKIRNKVYIF